MNIHACAGVSCVVTDLNEDIIINLLLLLLLLLLEQQRPYKVLTNLFYFNNQRIKIECLIEKGQILSRSSISICHE